MNLTQLERKLLAAARGNPPGDAVPYAFEKRVMANLKAAPAVDNWADWSRALWRAVAPCAAVMLLLSVWSLLPGYSAAGDDLEVVDLESTVLAAAEQDSSLGSTW